MLRCPFVRNCVVWLPVHVGTPSFVLYSSLNMISICTRQDHVGELTLVVSNAGQVLCFLKNSQCLVLMEIIALTLAFESFMMT
jgi:hypothetical protein